MAEKKEKKLNIHQRINAIMADLDYVQKENKRVNNQYTFVSHDAVTAALHPLLVKHGVNAIYHVLEHGQDGNRTEVDLQVSYINIDDPEDRVTCAFFGYGIDPQDKGPGKAYSYAKKYATLETFNLVTGDAETPQNNNPERDNIDHKPDANPGPAKQTPKAAPAKTQSDESGGGLLTKDEFKNLMTYLADKGYALDQLDQACVEIDVKDPKFLRRENKAALLAALEAMTPTGTPKKAGAK